MSQARITIPLVLVWSVGPSSRARRARKQRMRQRCGSMLFGTVPGRRMFMIWFEACLQSGQRNEFANDSYNSGAPEKTCPHPEKCMDFGTFATSRSCKSCITVRNKCCSCVSRNGFECVECDWDVSHCSWKKFLTSQPSIQQSVNAHVVSL